MRLDRKQLAHAATVRALKVRQRAGCAFWEPICVYDVAGRLGLEVRFLDIPSMEGVYCASAGPAIIVSSLRPPGRQAFTCAHEMGHHEFGDGDQYDEIVEQRPEERRRDAEEFQADCFAGALLMPKVVVCRGFSLRGVDPATAQPESFYIIATWLSVGYTTLIHHMRSALSLITPARADELLRHPPLALRSAILGRECREHLVVADLQWHGRAIDLQVGDLAKLPAGARVEGPCAEELERQDASVLVRAAAPGLGRVTVAGAGWAAYLRVSRRNYAGRNVYRFEEEADDAE